MHFGEMDHLPYRHAQFMPSSSMEVLQINSFFLMTELWLLHALVMLFMIIFFVSIFEEISLVGGFFSPSLDFLISFWRGVSPIGFSPFLWFIEIALFMGS